MSFLGNWKLTAGAIGLSAVFFWLWLGVKEDLAQEREACNVEHLQAALDAEIATREAQEAAHARELAERDQIAAEQRKSLQRAADAAESANQILAEHEKTIAQLQQEADFDEIPDSSACLNAYVPRAAIHWLCRQGEDRGGASAGAGAGAACSATGGFTDPDLVGSDFAAITYGGIISRWGSDRRNIVEANGRLEEIRRLEGEILAADN